jgi:hypothetical protein
MTAELELYSLFLLRRNIYTAPQKKAGKRFLFGSARLKSYAGWTDFTLPLLSTMQVNLRPAASRSTL